MERKNEKRDYIAAILALLMNRSRESYKHQPNFTRWAQEVAYLDDVYQQQMAELLAAFNKDYRQSIPEDGMYRAFVGLINSILVSIGNTGYDINGSDVSIRHLTAILGTLDPHHMPGNVDHRSIVTNCLRKRTENAIFVVKRTIGAHCIYPLQDPWWWRHCQYIARCTYWRDDICPSCRGEYNMFAEVDDEIDSPLYQYLQYVRIHEGGLHYVNTYFKDDKKTYWSGVVYYLVQSGCKITRRCVKMAMNFKDCGRCVKITRDILYVAEMDSICGMVNHTTQRAVRLIKISPNERDPFTLDVWKTWVEEKALFYQLIDNGLFCQHHQCMSVKYNPVVNDETVWQTIEAALRTPKSLRSFCRRAIRLSLPPGKVVESCYKLPIPRRQADYVSLKPLRANIAKFYQDGKAESFDTTAAAVTFHGVMRRYNIKADKDNIFW